MDKTAASVLILPMCGPDFGTCLDIASYALLAVRSPILLSIAAPSAVAAIPLTPSVLHRSLVVSA